MLKYSVVGFALGFCLVPVLVYAFIFFVGLSSLQPTEALKHAAEGVFLGIYLWFPKSLILFLVLGVVGAWVASSKSRPVAADE